MERFIRAVRLMSQACGYVAAGLIAAAVLIVCQMAFVRYVLGGTTIWQTDFATALTLLFVPALYAAWYRVQRTDRVREMSTSDAAQVGILPERSARSACVLTKLRGVRRSA